jgi:hypothetical protein
LGGPDIKLTEDEFNKLGNMGIENGFKQLLDKKSLKNMKENKKFMKFLRKF